MNVDAGGGGGGGGGGSEPHSETSPFRPPDVAELQAAADKFSAPPPAYVREINKLTNTVISSATIALVRAMINSPKATSASKHSAENLPGWFADEYRTRATMQSFMRQYAKDTLALTGAAYLMDGVEWAVKSTRGPLDDPVSKMMGGLAAGGFLGFLWHPVQPTGRAIMTAAGGLVGYISYVIEKSTKTVLLDQQQKLEKELLQKGDDELKKDMDPYYLRTLIRLKQRLQQQGQGQQAANSGFVKRADEQAAEERRGWPIEHNTAADVPMSPHSTGLSAWGDEANSAGVATNNDVVSIGGASNPDVMRNGLKSGGVGISTGVYTKWDTLQQQRGRGDSPWLVISDEDRPSSPKS